MGAIDFCLKAGMGTGTSRYLVPAGRLSQRRLDRAIEYMRTHLAEEVRLEYIAAAAGLSVFHFARLFRSTTGLAPYRYLMCCRVEKVKALLVESEKTLTDIAAETGFADQSHMCNVFRRFTGATPRSYRIGTSRVGTWQAVENCQGTPEVACQGSGC